MIKGTPLEGLTHKLKVNGEAGVISESRMLTCILKHRLLFSILF